MTYAGDSKRSWQLAALEHTGTSLTINGVNNGTTYIVGIRSKNGSGFSGWTNSDSTAPPAAARSGGFGGGRAQRRQPVGIMERGDQSGQLPCDLL